ncbi:putative GNAT family acetyltransferase [Nocardioides zeae]|uniref:GNAT family acetyltransferase n=1 Tax=Nocardioides zeae TaxID=1457234 RepID=A0ACC6IHZ7_9ACTN|nr:GNAT family N-acetyltransferase [Nocardioides zeae]MDR6173134.1 putative GNAT family acetyltransferase [Nocardioides zeae]MDR6210127.1 putative GNAT family acetyltransferase [Nocardioides zeae]
MVLTKQGVRVLGPADLDEFLALVERDPVINVFVDHRARTTRLQPRWLGGEVWGHYDAGDLVAACHVAANLVPVNADAEAVRAFAAHAPQRIRSVSTIVGPQPAVDTFWSSVSPRWGAPREIRFAQPHLEIGDTPLVAPDPEVRRTTTADMDALYPACVAMYTEEVGVSPERGGGAELYRARVAQLVARGWSFARFDDRGRVIFKAEVACTSPHAAQVQGVWVAPEHRRAGLATAGMAAVVETVRAEIAPVVSLYVNEWNTGARLAYERVGFVETARFTTVMF